MLSEKTRGFTFKKAERDKKKFMETIIRRLKALDGDISPSPSLIFG